MHTPGPWTIRQSPLDDDIQWIDGPPKHPSETIGAPIANSYEYGDDRTANARLIAAAPDLLSALIIAVKWPDRPDLWTEAASAAIARAKGE